MKKFIKTINSNYNKETGISTVTVASEIGIFTGLAKLHPEDIEIASSFAGCEYAEMRAILKYAKEKIKIINYQLQPLRTIYNDLSNRNNYNPNSIENKLLTRKIKELSDEKTLITIKKKNLEEKLKTDIENRPSIIKEIMAKKEKMRQDNN